LFAIDFTKNWRGIKRLRTTCLRSKRFASSRTWENEAGVEAWDEGSISKYWSRLTKGRIEKWPYKQIIKYWILIIKTRYYKGPLKHSVF
jgi:hypothetical protein